MGQKVNPNLIRLGITKGWRSRWFSWNNYRKNLKEDFELRDLIEKRLSKAGIEKIDIERRGNSLKIIIFSARPGFVIGRGGEGIELLKKTIIKRLKEIRSPDDPKLELKIDIEEIKRGDMPAAIIAQQMAEQIEKRFPYRRVLKQAIEKVMMSKNVKGVKVLVSGRLNGAEIARTEGLAKGRTPLSTLRADIDYAKATAFNTYGTVGIKVWIYRGEVLQEKSDK
jgi:small subunit ribosomal protein S3